MNNSILEETVLQLLKDPEECSNFKSWHLGMMLMMQSTDTYIDQVENVEAILHKCLFELKRLKEWRKNNL